MPPHTRDCMDFLPPPTVADPPLPDGRACDTIIGSGNRVSRSMLADEGRPRPESMQMTRPGT